MKYELFTVSGAVPIFWIVRYCGVLVLPNRVLTFRNMSVLLKATLGRRPLPESAIDCEAESAPSVMRLKVALRLPAADGVNLKQNCALWPGAKTVLTAGALK